MRSRTTLNVWRFLALFKQSLALLQHLETIPAHGEKKIKNVPGDSFGLHVYLVTGSTPSATSRLVRCATIDHFSLARPNFVSDAIVFSDIAVVETPQPCVVVLWQDAKRRQRSSEDGLCSLIEKGRLSFCERDRSRDVTS